MSWVRARPIDIEPAMGIPRLGNEQRNAASDRVSGPNASFHFGGGPHFLVPTNFRVTDSAFAQTRTIFGNAVTEPEYQEFRKVLSEIIGTSELVRLLDQGSLKPADVRSVFGPQIDALHRPTAKSSETNWSRFVELYLVLVPVAELDASIDLAEGPASQIASIVKKLKVDSATSVPLRGVSTRSKGQAPATKFLLSGTSMIFEDTRSLGTESEYRVREVFSETSSTAWALSLVVSLRLAHEMLQDVIQRDVVSLPQVQNVAKLYDLVRTAAGKRLGKRAGASGSAITSLEHKILLEATHAYALVLQLEAVLSADPAPILKKARAVVDEYGVLERAY